MKRIVVSLITFCLLMGLTVPAYAEDEVVTDQESPVIVSTFDELQATIANAEDGDVITLAKSGIIVPNGETVGDQNKHIILQLSEEYTTNYEFGGSVLIFEAGESISSIMNVSFNGKQIPICSVIHTWDNNLVIDGCRFSNCNCEYDSSLITTPLDGCNVNIYNSSFSNIHAVNAAIMYVNKKDQLQISNCIFENTYGNRADIVENEGIISLGANRYKGNDNAGSGFMVRNVGIANLNISVEDYFDLYGYTPKGWYVNALIDDNGYTLETTELLEIACVDWRCCLSFSSENRSPMPDNESETTPEMPSEPPEQPDNGKDEDIPTEPEQTPTTPVTPQEPANNDDDSEDDDTRPATHKPAHKPSTPVVTAPEPEDKPVLVCGNAVIDTSRSVILLGYGDGLSHEDDPLTRAQMATIIYRLLDDESIALCINAELAFADVAADAWYAPFVQTINCAGIVYGVGGGHYDPEGLVSWAQIVTVLSRFVEPQEYQLQNISYDGWAQEAVQTAVANGWIEDTADFEANAVITRSELVQLVNGVLAMYR